MGNEYYSVYDPLGQKYADCGAEKDAINLCFMVPGRTYRKNKFIADQVIDITATTDKELPGQQGLPPAKIVIEGQELEVQQSLPQSNYHPIHFRV